MGLFFNKIANKIFEKNEKSVMETPPLMRYRLIYDIKNAYNFILNNSKRTKELLDKKGFTYNLDDYKEKIVLLGTEISELADAFKKGKGAEAEGEEIADIIIRLMNIPCLFPDINKVITELMNELDDDKPSTATIYLVGVTKQDRISKIKYAFVYSMMKTLAALDETLVELQFWYDNNKTIKSRKVKVVINKAIINIVSFVCLCQLYSSDILRVNLQDLVDNKMKKNFQRPYRYNTAQEMFK